MHIKEDIVSDCTKVLVLVNPTSKMLVSLRSFIEKKYDDVLFDSIVKSNI
jgi:hypothetical protein